MIYQIKKNKKTGNEHQWSFTASRANPSITYTTVVPSGALGNYNFDAVYVLPPANIDNLRKTLNVRVITCGDGVCEGNENSDNCVQDCPLPPPPAEPQPPAVVEEEQTTEKGGVAGGMIVLIVIIIVAVGAFIYMRKKKPSAPVVPKAK